MTKLEEIVERAVEKAVVEHECASDDCTGESEIATEACLAVAKAVVEECAKIAWHDLACEPDFRAPGDGCTAECAVRRIRALLGKDGE